MNDTPTTATPPTTPADMTPGNIHPKSTLNRHPLAAVFPMMNAAQMGTLVESIKKHGQQEPIVIHEGMVLDGSNTLFAVCSLDKKPDFREFGSLDKDGTSPTVFVLTRNLHRRHLDPGQRSTCAVEIAPFLEKDAQARMEATQFKAATPAAPAANNADGEPVPLVTTTTETAAPAAEGMPAGATAAPAAPGEQGDSVGSVAGASGTGSALEQAAGLMNVSGTSAKIAKRLKKHHADLYEKVANAEMTLHAADLEAKKRDEAKKNSVSAGTKKSERISAIGVIEKRHGADSWFTMEVKASRLLKKHADLLEFADMPKKKAMLLLPLVKTGMSPKEAQKFLDARLVKENTIAEAISIARLESGDIQPHEGIRRVFVVGDFTITIEREAKEPPAPTPEPEPQQEAAPEIQETHVELDPDAQQAPAAE